MNVIDPQRRIAQLESELYWANLRIQALEEKLRLRRIQMLGPHSETLSELQLRLLAEEEPGVTADEVEAESKRPAVAEKARRERKLHPGRQPLPKHLSRVEQIVTCPAANCAKCGKQTAVIGYDESEYLDMEPVRYFVRVIKREKRVCRCCQHGGVTMAPLVARIIPKSQASDRVVVDTVVSKYCDHLPLYRQEAILEREAGVDLSRATLDGWVMRVGELARLIVGRMKLNLLRQDYLQADETTVAVQMHDGRGADHQAYLWQYGKPGGETVFDFRMGREREGPLKFLGNWQGILQTDGYQAYDGVGGPTLLHVGCWAHARRKFVDAVKVNPEDGPAIQMVTRMDALFIIEREARRLGLGMEERLKFRQEHAMPWVREIREQCEIAAKTVLPKSTFGQAVNYTLNQWVKLARCFQYGQVELSNNLAENSMRGVALGRKNWLHVGSEKSGPKVAAILSLTESCNRLQVPIVNYLLDVLPGLEDRPVSQLDSVTPAYWAARRS